MTKYALSRHLALLTVAIALAFGGCRDRETTVADGTDTAATATVAQPTATQPTATTPPPAPEPPPIRIEVNLAERELYVYRDGERVDTHGVAVGSKEWPTPTGEWHINQVVWNPEWIPPDEEWAKDEEPKAPGDPDNPLGRVQLVYNLPNTVHGTNAPDSIGKAVSHGSIRVSNDVAVKLGKQVMEAGGAGKDETWYAKAQENRKQKQVVNIPNPIPIRVVAGGA